MPTIFTSATVITPFKTIENGMVVVNDQGKIEYAGDRSNAPVIEGKKFDLKGKIISPGFIDIHVHGGKGVTFGMGDLAEDLEKYSLWAASNGVTGFLMSIAGPDAESTKALIRAYVPLLEKGCSGASAHGLHLEGPFLNPEKHGAFNTAWLRSPSPEEAKQYLEQGKGWVKQMTLAPELPNSAEIAAAYRKAGVVAALGHSNTDYEFASQALKGDFTHVTHTFNAQSSFSHRTPGVIGAVLTSNKVTGELIADGVHIHPGAMKVLLRCLGKDRIVLITDAMPAAGLHDGQYELIGQQIMVKDGKATLEDGTIAGSTATLNQCVNNMHTLAGASLQEAIQMASCNPAAVIGATQTTGSLETGKQADLIVIDEKVDVYLTMIKGKIVHNKL